MAQATNRVAVQLTTSLTLNEVEIQALEALVCYGADSFLDVFKKNLGSVYIRDHEEGIRSLFRAIQRDVIPAHRLIVQARKDLLEAERQRRMNSTVVEPAPTLKKDDRCRSSLFSRFLSFFP